MESTQKEPEILTSVLRSKLKAIIKKEIDALPDILEKMEPKERANFVAKILPYVFPKVEAINHSAGEPDDFSLKSWGS